MEPGRLMAPSVWNSNTCPLRARYAIHSYPPSLSIVGDTILFFTREAEIQKA